MSPGFVPHEARPQPPSVHSVNPETVGQHVDVILTADGNLFPLEALCKSCGQVIALLSRDAAWMHKELSVPAQRT